ncbi:MAG TPA: TIGR03621 family F420-dependent LLM class oxidoreductase [Acidimicrobiales bacterium]
MAHDRRFRFGAQLHNPLPGLSWTESARRIEDLGFSTLFMPDHFEDQLAPVPALAAAAAATTTLKIGTLVHGNDYRHPIVLAKEAATLDVLSDGRLEFGLGAGWMRTDYIKSGMAYDSPGVRISRMEESIQVIKGLFGPDPVSFDGDHYAVTGLNGLPKPVQPGGPKIVIGGGGPRMLGVAARHADVVALTANLAAGEVGPDAAADAVAERFDAKSARVKEVAGDRYDDLEINVLVMAAMVTDDRDGQAALLAQLFGVEPDEALTVPLAWVGSVEQICESLEERRQRWDISYPCVQGNAVEAVAPIVAKLTGN